MRNPLRNLLETSMTRLAFAVLPHLSRPVILRLSRFLGGAGYRFSRKLNRIGMANLDIAFGDEISTAHKKKILRGSYLNMSLVLLDTFWFSKDSRNRVERIVTFDSSYESLFQEKAQVCITAHFGNWEILGISVTQKGFPMHSVAKPLKNKKVDELFDAARLVTGQKIIKRDGAVRSMLRILQQGKKIALVMDQNVKLAEGGEMIPFFGLPASFSTAGAALAIKTKSNLIIATMMPTQNGTYLGDFCKEIDITPFIQGDPTANTSALTRVIVEHMEQIIRAKPELWLWTYKRWKYIPEDDDPEKYPFYKRAAV